jgi:eukaryotic-like serine/threonine-protein kinase
VRAERRHLHSRAAWGIEQASGGRADEIASVLGRHFALAGEPERAAHYLEVAGDQAASTFANDEALACYQWALELLAEAPGTQAAQAAAVLLKLGEVENRLGHFEAAVASMTHAAEGASQVDALLAARCYCRLGDVLGGKRQHEEGLRGLEARQELLNGLEDQSAAEWVSVWLDVQNELLGLFYWWQRPEPAGPIVERARPLIEAWGTPRQKAHFYNLVALQRLLANGLAADESIIADFRAERAAVVEGGLQNERYESWFDLGFALLWYGKLDEAEVELEEYLQLARRVGDKVVEMRTLTYVITTALRKGQVAKVVELCPVLEVLAESLGFDYYAVRARSMLAWARWKEGHLDEAQRLAEEALVQWERVSFDPIRWPGVLPLMAMRLADGRVAEAVEAARVLVGPRMQRLAGVQPVIAAAIEAWDDGRSVLAAKRLDEAVQLARELHWA